MFSRNSIGSKIYHHAKREHMSSVSKLKEPDGMLVLVNLKNQDQRNNSQLFQLLTAEPTLSQLVSRKLILIFINVQYTRPRTEEIPMCSPLS